MTATATATVPADAVSYTRWSFAPTLMHLLASRVIFDLAFVLTGMLRATDMKPGTEVALPDLRVINGYLARSVTNYGDFGWYQSVAGRGYDAIPFTVVGQHNWAFFPLHPLLISVIERPGFQFLAANAAFFAGMLLLHRYLRGFLDRRAADAAVMLMAYFPFSYCISQFRPETFMLLFSALALVLAQKGRRLDGALAAAAAGLAKPNAFLLSLLLAPYVWSRLPRRFSEAVRPLTPSKVLLVAAPFSGVAFLTLYLGALTGEPLAWAKVQETWGAEPFVAPWKAFVHLLTQPMLIGRGGWDPLLLHWIIFFGFLVCLAWLIREKRYLFALYAALYVAMTFTNFGVFVMGKHLSTCFPIFVGLALLLRGRAALTALVAGSAALLALNGVFNAFDLHFTRA